MPSFGFSNQALTLNQIRVFMLAPDKCKIVSFSRDSLNVTRSMRFERKQNYFPRLQILMFCYIVKKKNQQHSYKNCISRQNLSQRYYTINVFKRKKLACIWIQQNILLSIVYFSSISFSLFISTHAKILVKNFFSDVGSGPEWATIVQ